MLIEMREKIDLRDIEPEIHVFGAMASKCCLVAYVIEEEGAHYLVSVHQLGALGDKPLPGTRKVLACSKATLQPAI